MEFYIGAVELLTGSKARMGKIAVLIAAVMMMLTGCKDVNSDKTVAQVGGEKVIFSEFEKSMIENKFDMDASRASSSSMEERRNHAREMVFEKIIFDLVEKNKIDTMKVVREEYSKRMYNYSIINGLVKDSIRGRIYSEGDLKEMYEKRKIKYLPKHILFDTQKHKEGPAKSKIDSVYQKLLSGEKFEDLARKYSDDVATGADGGSLGWVFSYELLEELEAQLLTLKKGEFSKPFKTQYGYHVLLHGDEKKNDVLKVYEKEKQLMINDLDKKYSHIISGIQDRILNDLAVKYQVRIDSVNIKQFIKQLKKYNSQAGEDSKNDPVDSFSEHEKKWIIAEFEDNKIEASALLSAIKMYPKDRRPAIEKYDDVRGFVLNRFRNRMIEKYVDELGYTKRPEFISEVRKGMAGFYKEKVTNLMVRSKVPDPSDEELMKYYEENKETFAENDGSFKEFKKVKAGILNSIKGKRYSQALKDWEDNLFADYGVFIDYKLLELTFYKESDDRK
jgi:hypothetical protein